MPNTPVKKRELEDCKKTCDSTQKNMAEKLDEIKEDVSQLGTEIKISLAKLPQDLTDRFDKRYASKSVEAEIESLRKKGGVIIWDVMKIISQALVALGVAYVALIK
jgi:peptidoglycan hydrolase CwlO-like protein